MGRSSQEEEEAKLFEPGASRLMQFGSSNSRPLHQMKTLMDDFKSFIRQGNVVDLAVGLVMGGAFTAIVNSFVQDIISPFIGLLTENNLENSFWVLKCPVLTPDCHSLTWATVAAAHSAGAITVNWGIFLQMILNFFISALFIFFAVIKVFSILFPEEDLPPKKCEYCLAFIKGAAVKCQSCGSDVNDMK